MLVGLGGRRPVRAAERIRGLDGLRAIAVLLVFLQHKTSLFGKLETGSYGVWLFFVLSGFLIIRILHTQRVLIESGASGFSGAIRSFMSRRSLRIFPVYYFVLAVTLPLFLISHSDSGRSFRPEEALFNLFYVSNLWIGNWCKEWVGPFSHLWSLSIEEQFYVGGAAIFLLVPSRHTRLACLAIVMLGIVTKIHLELSHALSISIYTNSLVNFSFIAYGGACALYAQRHGKAGWSSKVLSPAILAAYLALPAVFHALGIMPKDLSVSQWSPLLVGPLLISIVANQRQWLVALLELWPLRSLGKISYGFYLYHNFSGYLVSLLQHGISRIGGMAFLIPEWANASICFAATLAAAALSWKYLERPLLRPRLLVTGSRREAPLTVVTDA